MSAALSLSSSILDLCDGLHEGLSEAEYHRKILGVASKSALQEFDRAPAAYISWLKEAPDEGEEEPEALTFGKAFHCGLLEPQVYADAYAVEPKFGDCRKKDNKARRDDWRAENDGKQFLTQASAAKIAGMVRAIEAHPKARDLFRGGVPELTLKWTDPTTGIICKGRGDYYIESLGTCVDVKTCADARQGAFSKSASTWGYDRQNAFYEDAFAILGKPLDTFAFVAIEKRAPYLIGLFYVEQHDIERAREWYCELLGRFAECIETGRWRGYSEEFQALNIRRWTP